MKIEIILKVSLLNVPDQMSLQQAFQPFKCPKPENVKPGKRPTPIQTAAVTS
jgi:hypothetical protein